jgi:hypothetical protein
MFKTQKPSSKMLVSVFWDKDGVLLVDYLVKSAAVISKDCVALLDKLKYRLPPNIEGRFGKESCFFKTMLLSKGGHYAP